MDFTEYGIAKAEQKMQQFFVSSYIPNPTPVSVLIVSPLCSIAEDSNVGDMVNEDLIAYNVASFICALFVLEFGADKFVDHTAIVACRTGISQALIGLLTAGAEWEVLVVVIASATRDRSSLAVGNIVGSTISNILGAFSLGLLFHSRSNKIVFDRSSKIYSLLLLLLCVFVTLLTFLGTRGTRKIFGGILLALFVIYVASV
ncbi:hypothetical protein LTR28_002164, partial [Elasticomyces elasticus]